MPKNNTKPRFFSLIPEDQFLRNAPQTLLNFDLPIFYENRPLINLYKRLKMQINTIFIPSFFLTT